jgi:hypothetical protein
MLFSNNIMFYMLLSIKWRGCELKSPLGLCVIVFGPELLSSSSFFYTFSFILYIYIEIMSAGKHCKITHTALEALMCTRRDSRKDNSYMPRVNPFRSWAAVRQVFSIPITFPIPYAMLLYLYNNIIYIHAHIFSVFINYYYSIDMIATSLIMLVSSHRTIYHIVPRTLHISISRCQMLCDVRCHSTCYAYYRAPALDLQQVPLLCKFISIIYYNLCGFWRLYYITYRAERTRLKKGRKVSSSNLFCASLLL